MWNTYFLTKGNSNLRNRIKHAIQSDNTNWSFSDNRKRINVSYIWHVCDITITIGIFVVIKVGGNEIITNNWGVPRLRNTPESRQTLHQQPCQDVEYNVVWKIDIPPSEGCWLWTPFSYLRNWFRHSSTATPWTQKGPKREKDISKGTYRFFLFDNPIHINHIKYQYQELS